MNRSHFKLKQSALIAASVALIFADGICWANPTGAQVVNGTVGFARPNASTLNVTNSPGAIVHWQGFSIGASEVTRFIQQSASSAILNRVVGGNISQIQGQLLSNGRVFLINPGGIVVGPGAVIDTAGFVGSTLNMLDADFLAGKLKFQGDADSGSIINQGWIRTSYGGQVILVAPQIENSGLIHTPGGELILAAGKSLTITSLDLEGVQFEVQAPTDGVLNVGKLLADGGAVGVFAGTLRHSGDIRANALVYDEAGRVILKGQNEVQIAAGSTIAADGRSGGSITVQSPHGATQIAGTVSAQGSAGQGGSISLLGNDVSLVGDAVVDASGSAGGGGIRVGGDFQGSNALIQNATNAFVGASATLRADASQAGDGGRIIVWSDDKTQFYGSLSARGGPGGGNGGFAEVSGKQNLIFDGSASLGAPQGGLGTLLLDPPDVFVFTGGGLDATIPNPNFVPNLFPSNAATVSPTTLANVVGNVALHATRYMRIIDPIDLSATPGQGLTATVGTYAPPALPDPLGLATNTQINNIPNRLELGADITTAGGAVSLTAPVIQTFAGSTIATAGGAVSVTSTTGAIQASALTVDAGAGAVGAVSNTSLQLGAVTGGSFNASAPDFISMSGAITTSGGPVTIASGNSSFSTFSTIDTRAGGTGPSGGAVSITAPFSVTTRSILAGNGNITLSGSSLSNSSGAPLDTTGAVSLTATAGSISSFRVNNASSVTANATNSSGSASVSLFSDTVLNANTVAATTTQCFTNGFCSSASVSLSGEQGVNVGTVTATAPTNFLNKASFGDAYADERFESINSSVNVFSNAGPILAQSATSLITANNVTLGTTAFNGTSGGGGIGSAATPVRVDARSRLNFSPNGEFNTQIVGATGPNSLSMQVGVAPTGAGYTGTLTKAGQINLNVSATDTTVTASTLDISSGFDTRIFNTNPFVQLRVPNGNLVATAVNVPKGDQVGIVSPGAQFAFDQCIFNCSPPTPTIEPLSVVLGASKDLQVDNYTRVAGGIAKQTTFQAGSAFSSTPGSVTLGAIAASKDTVSVTAGVNASITNLTSGGGSISTTQGDVAVSNWSSSGSASITSNQGNVTIGLIDTSGGTGSVSVSATGAAAGMVKAQTDGTGVEITSSGSILITATAIGDPSFSNPLDLAGTNVGLTSRNAGAIGAAGKPVVANTQTLTVDAGSGSTFNVSSGTTNLQNLTVTASPSGVGNGGLARVTSNGTNYDFASDGTNFALGGTNFPAAVPAAQFAGGTLSFTATGGNLTLNALDFSASNGSFSATTNGNLANVTQTAGQAINLGTGTISLKADGNVTLEGVNAGGLSVTNATSVVGSGCTSFFGPCGVTSFTANQTLTGTGTWSVTSRGAITTAALQVAGINFTTNGSGNITTGAIGTAGIPASSVSMATTSGSGGNVQINGPMEADSLTISARGNVTIGTGSLPTDQANLIINASNTDAASIDLSTQTGTITVNGALNASSVTFTSPSAISTGNVSPTAIAPASITFNSTSSVDVSTGSLDATSVVAQSACNFYCPPGDITINGAIGGTTAATTVSLDGTSGTVLSVAGPVTLDTSASTNLFMRSSGAITLGGAVTSGIDQSFGIFAGTTLTGASNGPLNAVTAGDGSRITLSAGTGNVLTPFQFTRIDAGATGSVTVTAPAGIKQNTGGASDGITAGTVTLSATAAGSAIEGPASTSPLPLVLRETSDLTLNTGGSVRLDRTGASGPPLLSNLNITRSDSTAVFDLAGFATGQNVTVTNVAGGVDLGVSNTTGTPLNFTYRNTDAAVDGNVTGTGITTGGGAVVLSATGILTTGAIDSRSGVTTTPDGFIDLAGGALLNVNGTVNSGASSIDGSASAVSGTGQLISTSPNSVSVTAFSGNIGTSGTPLAISAPTVTLRASGSNPSGNVFATLTGTNNLTLDADDGLTVTSSVPLTTLNLTTFSAGVGPVSLATDNSQSFGFVRNGTTLDVTGVTSTAPLTSFTLTTIGSLTAKGSIAANNLTLNASGGTLTLDGSTSALMLSSVTQDLAGQNVVITGTVNASATSSQSIFGSSSVNFTGTGTLSSGGNQSIDSFGNIDITSQGGAINITGNSQSITPNGNLTFSATGGAIAVSGVNQTIRGDGSTSAVTLQGGGTAGQSVTVSASGSQLVQTLDNTTSSIRLLGGGGTDAAASIVYTGTGTQNVQGGDVILTAAGAAATISTATGSQLVRANRDIKLTADAAEAKIASTSGLEQQVGESRCFGFSCTPQPYQTDNIVLQGGTGAQAAITASGEQRIQADQSAQVLGGSGAGGKASIETNSATNEQRIGCGASGSGESCATTLNTLTLTAGAGGAFAEIVTPGTQRMRGSSNLTLTGHADDGGYARISSGGSLQTIQFGNTTLTAGQGMGSNAEILYSGTGLANFDSQTLALGAMTLAGGGTAGGNTAVARISSSDPRADRNAQRITASSVMLTGGAGPNSLVEITTLGRQDLSLGVTTMAAGTGGGSLVRINTPADQSLSFSSLSMTANGTDVAPIANASAIVEGQNQSIFAGAITLNGGSGISGSTSDSVIRNLAGNQFVSVNNITMRGGHTLSTAGILNQGTGTQTVNASGGITMQSDPLPPTGTGPAFADAFVLIQNTPATDQVINASLSLTNSGLGTVAVTTPAKQTIIANNGGISINTLSTDANSVTGVMAGSDQLIRARFVDVQTAAGSAGNATLSAAGNQWIHTTSGTSSSSGNSMRVAALGTGTASATAGTSQLLELDYPEQMQGGTGGNLMIGDVNVRGISRVKAADQNIFARSITIQSGLVNSVSELEAGTLTSGTQTISTLLGGISVLGGSGDNSLAQIDPLTQTILSNGTLNVQGGNGVNAVAQIVSGSAQTIYTTNGNLTLSGGNQTNAAAFITNAGPTSVIGTTGTAVLTAGTATGADALITVGPGGSGTLILTCGLGCTLPTVGPTPTAGTLASGGVVIGPALPTGPLPISTATVTNAALAAEAANDSTQSLLALEEDQEDTRLEAEPETADAESTSQPGAPICT